MTTGFLLGPDHTDMQGRVCPALRLWGAASLSGDVKEESDNYILAFLVPSIASPGPYAGCAQGSPG